MQSFRPTVQPPYQLPPNYKAHGSIIKNEAPARIIPIAALNPYPGGEMRATCFNAVVDRFRRVWYASRCSRPTCIACMSFLSVWPLVRSFDQPQRYKPFVSRCIVQGDLKIGSLREVNVKSGLPATMSTERLELLDDEEHILGVRFVGGDHRLKVSEDEVGIGGMKELGGEKMRRKSERLGKEREYEDGGYAAEVWPLVRSFDQPQRYKPFVSRCIVQGDLKIGSLRGECEVRASHNEHRKVGIA
ncbi:Abscisic acid receptor PYL9 [Camellia lanceoleosa]|uniref:Abscisic acid receptor PYL9 n=1 Tax=Camellia lanceoleosa TaxID=1840588 RepID=A0ACC0I8U1_9ERIC|nr:Abscisic acid receptor PYL9 [Camellia lanceoleosa]